MSASGYMATSGTYAPWSRPRVGSLAHRLVVGHEGSHRRRQLGCARGVVALLVVAPREAVEVVRQGHGVVAPRVTGADSQWALTTRIELGRGRSAAQAASWPDQTGSSSSGGAPCPR